MTVIWCRCHPTVQSTTLVNVASDDGRIFWVSQIFCIATRLTSYSKSKFCSSKIIFNRYFCVSEKTKNINIFSLFTLTMYFNISLCFLNITRSVLLANGWVVTLNILTFAPNLLATFVSFISKYHNISKDYIFILQNIYFVSAFYYFWVYCWFSHMELFKRFSIKSGKRYKIVDTNLLQGGCLVTIVKKSKYQTRLEERDLSCQVLYPSYDLKVDLRGKSLLIIWLFFKCFALTVLSSICLISSTQTRTRYCVVHPHFFL